MLKITIPAIELFDEMKEEFFSSKEQILILEHSLVSLSKWESKWCKPFLSLDKKTREESIDYIRCMTITQNVDPQIYNYITDDALIQVSKYIDEPMTATVFTQEQSSIKKREIVTSEIIYYWMVALNIPFECQKWHLNRLITLINVCNIKNKPDKKMTKKETLMRNASLNAARKRALNTKG